jgi:conjugative relaxase-like TrwC/TraI family protein
MVASIGRITAGTGYRYLADEVATSKHDYYAGQGESPGVWAGSGLHEFGLRGTVRERDMEALYGRFVDPRTVGGNEITLGRRVSSRVMHEGTPREKKSEPLAALDVTFSPLKSVSALWAATPSVAVRDAVQGAHDVAVGTALDYLEANASHTRTGARGVRRLRTGGFIIATFRHRTSRSTAPGERIGDPQLHTHCAILNRLLGEDGVWRTLDSRAIYRHAHAAGALYAATFERELTNRLGVEWLAPPEDKRVPMREIAGVPDSVIAHWSSRRMHLMATYEQLTDDFRESHGRTPTRNESAQLKDRATIQSRQRKAGGISDLHAEWRNDLSQAELAEIDHAAQSAAWRRTPSPADASQPTTRPSSNGHSTHSRRNAHGGPESTSTQKSPS